MAKYVDLFMSGYNVNMLTHGQTGSGKTHTIFGPQGALVGAVPGEIRDTFGIFPRGVLAILKQVNPQNQKLTMNITEAGWGDFRCMVSNRKGIKIVPGTTADEFFGQ